MKFNKINISFLGSARVSRVWFGRLAKTNFHRLRIY
jgi:hypothetical protein